MSYRVLNSNRVRPAPTPDTLGLVQNAMRQDHPHARFGHFGLRIDAHVEGQPLRSQVLALAMHEPVAAHPAQRFCLHKPIGTPARPHKERGLMNRAFAISAAHASSVRKLAALHRDGLDASQPDPDLAITHVHPRRHREDIRWRSLNIGPVFAPAVL